MKENERLSSARCHTHGSRGCECYALALRKQRLLHKKRSRRHGERLIADQSQGLLDRLMRERREVLEAEGVQFATEEDLKSM